MMTETDKDLLWWLFRQCHLFLQAFFGFVNSLKELVSVKGGDGRLVGNSLLEFHDR
jgi:hypothetical protein